MTKYSLTEGEEHALFLRHLGTAFAQWGNVENALVGCVVTCFPETERHLVAVGLFSVNSFGAKLEFADKVLSEKLHGTKHAADWPVLLGRAQRAAPNRNSIAHMGTRQFPDGKPGRRILLCPWVAPKQPGAKEGAPPSGSLGILDIARLGLDFNALSTALLNFQWRLMGRPEPYPKSEEQAADLPTMQTLVRLIHAELGHPPKPLRK